MFTIDELLSKKNQQAALASFHEKRDGAGPDGMRVSELDGWWKANHEIVTAQIRDGSYHPGMVRCFEVATHSGKLREVASINVADRLVEKLLQLKLRRYLHPLFLPHSMAYQEGKGPLEAAMLARDYVVAGNSYLCELDIKDYFGSIDLDRLRRLLDDLLDDRVAALIGGFLTREVEQEGKVSRVDRGLLQGSAISPPLANLYLHAFDGRMESMGLNWLRFSDDVNVYCASADEASEAYATLRDVLADEFRLALNKKKSGVYRALDRRVLGYDLVEGASGIEVRRHAWRPARVQGGWKASVAKSRTGAYHIVQDGVINRKDYSLLFENDDERHHIPVGVTDQLNVYGSVTVAHAALRTITRAGIRIAYLDEHGELMGTYVPEGHGKAADVFLRQCALYNDPAARLDVARRMEIAGIHNMRENLRYYDQRGKVDLAGHVAYLSACVVEANECRDVDALMLVEARARRRYYDGFSLVVEPNGFGFAERTRRPPRDPCNAMISFGNTVLYNLVLQDIWKTALDPKVGVVHATNRRNHSLNLDIADLFKPVIVDRVILALVNRREVRPETHFREAEGGGMLMSADGKRVFLERFERKLDSAVRHKGRTATYRQLVRDEVGAFQCLVRDGVAYRPYKYY